MHHAESVLSGATQDDGTCVIIPTCGEGESALTIEVNGNDSLIELGFYYSVYWNLTDENGMHVDLVYDYSQYEMAAAYGCLADGCYNFFLYDYGWEPGMASVDVTIGSNTTTYAPHATLPKTNLKPHFCDRREHGGLRDHHPSLWLHGSRGNELQPRRQHRGWFMPVPLPMP